jgi:hypothetical protein
VLERAKTDRALDRAATAIGLIANEAGNLKNKNILCFISM